MDINKTIQLAMEYFQAGDLQQAESICKEILENQPNNIDILHMLGIIYSQLGNYDFAVKYIKEVLELNPTNAYAHYNLGLVFHGKRLLDEAINCYQKALQLNPTMVDVYNNLGVIFKEKGQIDKAIIYYQKALQLNPNFDGTYNNIGNALKEKGLFDEAIPYFQKALQLNPRSIEAYNNIGIILKEKRQFDNAILYFQTALQLNPNNAISYNNLGSTFQEKEQFDEAIACYQKALQINPNLADAYNNLGNALQEKGQLDEAINCYQKALQINPNLADAYNNLGSSLREKGQLDEAINCYQKALQINPNLADSLWNMSLALLLTGDFKQGWKKYEWRFLKKDANLFPFPQPRWDGSSLEGRTLFVHNEQGIGDEIMFASCLPEVIAQADSCIVECDKRLVPLFTRSFPKALIIEHVKSKDLFPNEFQSADFKIAIGSLPLFLRPDISSFPHQKSYLIADSQKVNRWNERLAELGPALKVGISWRGGKEYYVRRIRSTTLEQWNILFSIPEIHFINLQYGDCSAELKEVREKFGITIYDREDIDPLKNLDDFAACIAALDLVISVDNATVHMAGALGVPVWTLLPFVPDWRWMLNREDSLWYPTMRLFRQPSPGDWNSVIKQVEDALRVLIMKNSFSKIENN